MGRTRGQYTGKTSRARARLTEGFAYGVCRVTGKADARLSVV